MKYKKIFFRKTNTIFWVGAIFLGRSGDSKQIFFYGRPYVESIYLISVIHGHTTATTVLEGEDFMFLWTTSLRCEHDLKLSGARKYQVCGFVLQNK